MKTIKIETLEDIINKVPTENLEMFLIDLKSFVTLRKSVNILTELIGAKHETKEYMQWINDGKNKVTVTVKTK